MLFLNADKVLLPAYPSGVTQAFEFIDGLSKRHLL